MMLRVSISPPTVAGESERVNARMEQYIYIYGGFLLRFCSVSLEISQQQTKTLFFSDCLLRLLERIDSFESPLSVCDI